MKSSVLSIVTPSFQQAKYVGATIESVLNQAGDFLIDYIIMDGGSSDGSADIIKSFEQKLKDNCQVTQIDGHDFYVNKPGGTEIKCAGISYRWKSERDAGQADGINKGIAVAFGEIFSFVNSDDVYEQGAFQIIADEFSRKPEFDVIYGNATYIDEHGAVIGMYPPQDINKQSINVNCVISQPSAFIKMSTLKKFGPFNKNFRNSLDYEYWLRLWHGEAKFDFIQPVLSSTRLHDLTKTKLNRMTINMESFAAITHYNGHIPWKAKATFALETSFFGKLSFYLISFSKLLQSVFARIYSPIYFLFYKGKVEDTRKRLFESQGSN